MKGIRSDAQQLQSEMIAEEAMLSKTTTEREKNLAQFVFKLIFHSVSLLPLPVLGCICAMRGAI
jgi:hypothetical protein